VHYYFLLQVNTISVQLRDRDKQLQQHVLEKQKIIQKSNIKIQAETDRMTKEMETKLQEQRKRLTVYFKSLQLQINISFFFLNIRISSEIIFNDLCIKI